MLAIQNEWESLCNTAKHARGREAVEKYGLKDEKLDPMLEDILNKNLSKEDLRNLAATCETLPIRETDQDLFTRVLLKFMVRAFTETGDKQSLVKVLSTRCPDCIYHTAFIEYYLAQWGGEKLTDPILILGEAYAKCRVPEVRRHIAVAFRRGFTSMGIHGKDDDEFVANAMQWYEKEKDHLYVNPGYLLLEAPPLYEEEVYTKKVNFDKIPPLFIEKSGR